MRGESEGSFEAEDVRFVAEVLSPSTREFDMFEKLEEYRAMPSMRYVLLVEPNAPRAILWSRLEDMSWAHDNLDGEAALIGMPELAVSFALGEIYAGLTFPPSPKVAASRA